MNENVDMSPAEIDFILQSSQQSAAFSLEGIQLARARAHALLLVLLSGGAGMGSFGLAQWGSRAGLSAVLLVAAVWWFALASWLAWRALASDGVRSWAPGFLLDTHHDWCRYRDELVSEGQLAQADAVDIQLQLKLAAVRAAAKAQSEYRDASTKAFMAIDQVYRAMACTPLIACFGFLVPLFYR